MVKFWQSQIMIAFYLWVTHIIAVYRRKKAERLILWQYIDFILSWISEVSRRTVSCNDVHCTTITYSYTNTKLLGVSPHYLGKVTCIIQIVIESDHRKKVDFKKNTKSRGLKTFSLRRRNVSDIFVLGYFCNLSFL